MAPFICCMGQFELKVTASQIYIEESLTLKGRRTQLIMKVREVMKVLFFAKWGSFPPPLVSFQW